MAGDIVTIESLYLSWLKRSNISVDIRPLFDKFMENILKPTLEFVGQSSASCIIAAIPSYMFVVTIFNRFT